jgi:peptidoglycan/xylan/chitin deacetylase (PgdA/CDA1 family)
MALDLVHTAGRVFRRSLRFAAPFVGTEVPVLTYHSIDTTGSLLSVHPDMFRAQIAHLKAENWRCLSIAEYLDQVGAATPEPRTFLITFDDGYRNFGQYAAPLLAEFGFTATVFVPVDFVGKQPLWLERDRGSTGPLLDKVGMSAEERRALEVCTTFLLRDLLMDWTELRELTKAGFDIQSHSSAHFMLTKLSADDVAADMTRSRLILEDRLGVRVAAIAYPYGDANGHVAAAARASGFDVGFVSDHGPRDAQRMMSWRGGVSDRQSPTELISLLRSWPLYPRLRHLVRRARGCG